MTRLRKSSVSVRREKWRKCRLSKKEGTAMYNTILVSLDGSLEAEAALWEVEKLLAVHPAKVILLSVEPTVDLVQTAKEMRSSSLGPTEGSSEDIGLLTYRSDAEVREYLEPIAKRLEKSGS